MIELGFTAEEIMNSTMDLDDKFEMIDLVSNHDFSDLRSASGLAKRVKMRIMLNDQARSCSSLDDLREVFTRDLGDLFEHRRLERFLGLGESYEVIQEAVREIREWIFSRNGEIKAGR